MLLANADVCWWQFGSPESDFGFQEAAFGLSPLTATTCPCGNRHIGQQSECASRWRRAIRDLGTNRMSDGSSKRFVDGRLPVRVPMTWVCPQARSDSKRPLRPSIASLMKSTHSDSKGDSRRGELRPSDPGEAARSWHIALSTAWSRLKRSGATIKAASAISQVPT